MTVSDLIKKTIVRSIEIRRSLYVKQKTRRICKNIDPEGLKKTILSLDIDWLKALGHPINKELIAAYALISGVPPDEFVPEDVYYSKIEPVLNNRLYALAYADKNFYERYLVDYQGIFPEVVFRRIGGMYLNKDYSRLEANQCAQILLSRDGQYIAKPSTETSGGDKVLLIEIDRGVARIDGQAYSSDLVKLLGQKLGANFIVQHRVEQHQWFADINVSSLNTIRLMTYRSVSDESVKPISAVLRFGQPNSLVDNQASGGMTCGISGSGELNSFVVSKFGRKETRDWLKQKSGTAVPGFSQMCEYAKQIAPHYHYHRLLGFDFCVDNNNNVKLIEINLKNLEINFLQMNNGPLFGAHSREVIDYCAVNKKSYMMGYYG